MRKQPAGPPGDPEQERRQIWLQYEEGKLDENTTTARLIKLALRTRRPRRLAGERFPEDESLKSN